ncbi:MAG: hypothetical protein ACRC7O_00720 [Fimbriiglobus sp.]
MPHARTPTRIWEVNHGLVIAPPLPALAATLCAPGIAARVAPDGTVHVEHIKVPFVEVSRDSGVPFQFCGAGHKPEVEAAAAAAGTLLVDGTPDAPPLAGFGAATDPAVLRFMAANRRGVIRYDARGRVSPARLIAQVAAA